VRIESSVPEQLCHSALLTDLYELTMAAAYFESGRLPGATFELFVRRLPGNRSFLLTAGLEQALYYLENLRFIPAEIDFLRRQPVFEHVSAAFFEYLEQFRFTGEVWAMAEGTPAFAQEPLLRVTAPIIEAQIVETFLLTVLTFQTMIAGKAARVVEAAQGRAVIEFGTRRAHGPEAGVLAARAAYVGGCAGTSNVEAGFRFGVPTFGTLAHSFVMAFDDELESFREMERIFPNHSVLLVDTYDTMAAIEKIISAGLRPRGVRLDSGNLAELANQARQRLDQAGLRETKIFASGDLNEYVIAELVAQGAPLDMFGVGTELATSKDAPALSGVYKLVELIEDGEHSYRIKLSHDKVTYPGAKQVFRYSREGLFERDVIARQDEQYAGAEPLLECVMRGGRRLAASPPIEEVQKRARQQLLRLPERYRRLRHAEQYPVEVSGELRALEANERKKHTQR
jgi:nicotinate phosphoribosyltransferase